MSDDTDSEYQSNREAEPVIKRTVDARVGEYFVEGDEGGLNYDDHYFRIHIKVENLCYTVDRSYVDFVELDRRLRKRFPRSDIMALPLDATEVLDKILTDKERGSKRKSLRDNGITLASARDAIITGFEVSTSPLNSIQNILSNGANFRIREKYQENFTEKVSSLDTYLVGLLTLPEVVASDDIMLFLDEEASSMDVDPHSLQPLSEHDLLLLNLPVNKCTVRRTEVKSFVVQTGQLILWRFSTIDFDIGFSVEMGGEIKIPFTRYKSHEKAITGTLEATTSGACLLKWDNTYARLRTKQLSWVARVVNDKEYHQARAQALEIQREKKKFEDQRHALRRCSVNHVALLSGVILNESIVSEHAHEEKMRIKELEDEINNLKLSVRQYQQDIEQGQIELDALEDELNSVEKSRQLINESWQFSIKQLESTKSEIKVANNEIASLKSNERSLKSVKQHLEEEVIKLRNELQKNNSRENEIISNYKIQLEKLNHDLEMERKSCQSLLLQSEDKLRVESERIRLETEERIKAEYEIKMQELRDQCSTLEQMFLKATAPKDIDSIGYFEDTVSEIELRQRLEQLEQENSFLEYQKNALNNELRQVKKQLEDLTPRK